MRARGFTLVEVLVALVIVAAGAAAVLSSLNTAAASTVYLRDKTFAGWIAGNRIAEVRLQTTPPQNGTTEGEVDYAGQRWRWRQVVADSAVPGLRRIDVSVRPKLPDEPAGAAAATSSAAAPATSGEDVTGGDWTMTMSGVIGRDLATPGASAISINWEPQAPPNGNLGGGNQTGGNAPAGANGANGTNPGNPAPASPDGTGAPTGEGATSRNPEPLFPEGPRT